MIAIPELLKSKSSFFIGLLKLGVHQVVFTRKSNEIKMIMGKKKKSLIIYADILMILSNEKKN